MKAYPKKLETLQSQALSLGYELTYSPSKWVREARSSANLKGGYFSEAYYYLEQVGSPTSFHIVRTQEEVKAIFKLDTRN